MIELRKSKDRGYADHGWLKSFHTFSFADYHDPEFMGFSDLRVINEDWVEKAKGFGTHPHRDMEIVTYVLEGALEHKDSMGNGSVMKYGDVQRMTAGTGVTHSEFNHSDKETVHLLQIWILPERRGLTPGYEQKNFGEGEKLNKLRVIASRDGRHGSVTIHQDASIFASILESGKTLEMPLGASRAAWIQVISGDLIVDGARLQAGDAAAVVKTDILKFQSQNKTEFLVFDLRA
jgi:redox-sensitive bicupin YhaK (pirin superfamily)